MQRRGLKLSPKKLKFSHANKTLVIQVCNLPNSVFKLIYEEKQFKQS